MSDEKPSLKMRLRGRLRRATNRLLGKRPSQKTHNDLQATLVVNDDSPISVRAGDTLLTALINNGYDISHYCGGMASCGTCRIVIRDGSPHLSKIQGREQMVLGYESAEAGDRLACQARIHGPVTVEIPRWF